MGNDSISAIACAYLHKWLLRVRNNQAHLHAQRRKSNLFQPLVTHRLYFMFTFRWIYILLFVFVCWFFCSFIYLCVLSIALFIQIRLRFWYHGEVKEKEQWLIVYNCHRCQIRVCHSILWVQCFNVSTAHTAGAKEREMSTILFGSTLSRCILSLNSIRSRLFNWKLL